MKNAQATAAETIPSLQSIHWRNFETPEQLASNLAAQVAQDLRAAIAERGAASMAVSGGTTPVKFLKALSLQKLDWGKVTVCLVDERWQPESMAGSNQKMLFESFINASTCATKFVSLINPASNFSEGLSAIAGSLEKVNLPWDALILGMGSDGHCASLFADGDKIDAALSPTGKAQVLLMQRASNDELRITLTLPTIVNTHNLYLHIEGDDKQRVLESALLTSASTLPISAVLKNCTTVPQIFWCPK